MPAPVAHTFTARTVQSLRALFAAAAALMITFSSDHSAQVGLAVFSGFAVATALVCVLAAWLVAASGNRWPWVLLAAISFIAGVAGGVPMWRSDVLFFVLVIVWAAATGLVELIVGIRGRRARAQGVASVPGGVADDTSRDALLIGALGMLLAVVLLVVPVQYALDYSIEGAGDFTLTGITIAVGLFGGYAAIVAVILGIAAFSPRTTTPDRADIITEAPAPRAEATDKGGHA